jgi:hypothetical protein
VFAAGTRTLLATRLVDSGSGYNTQNDMPVHIGLPSTERVDIEVAIPRGGTRGGARVTGVTPGGLFEIRVD